MTGVAAPKGHSGMRHEWQIRRPSGVGRTGAFDAKLDADGLVFGNLDRNDSPGHFIINSNALLRFSGLGCQLPAGRPK
ncbi:MAG: hypothetical protein E5Y02_31710 [Mesorhizobium sp.]|nr:MAG: hypothetical protein E5Y02_31710 [Mesorhizobium sp.]